jgi:hypothetical protein
VGSIVSRFLEEHVTLGSRARQRLDWAGPVEVFWGSKTK